MKAVLQTILLAVVSCSLLPTYASAQCAAGEVELSIDVVTDAYGYEGYWQLTPGGSACGTGTIGFGGNDLVGCNGGGAQTQNPGGYGNNQTYNEGPWCVTQGNSYSLHYVDDYADGGFDFIVKVNGYTIGSYTDNGAGATFTFTAQEPPAFDASASVYVMSTPIQDVYIQPAPFNPKAVIKNHGINTINSLTMNYKVNGGATVSAPVTGLNIANSQSAVITHPTAWTPTDGSYTIEIWASDLNGSADNNTSNDIAVKTIAVGPAIYNSINYFISGAPSFDDVVTTADQLNKPTDIDFHSVLTNNQLWIVNKETETNGGSVVIVNNPGQANQTDVFKEDGNGWHFMSLPTGIAFGANGNFGTSPGVLDANHDGGTPFTGPALWSGDLSIFAQPSGGNGSHIDMLHESPKSQGIAWEKDNVYWLFDGYNQDIVRYDFANDHDPGNDDHADAIIHRYADQPMYMDANEEVVSHLVLDENKQWLYVVNHGVGQVIRIDITTGSPAGAPSWGPHEPIAEYLNYTGYTQQTVVSTGLVKPAGIDVVGDRMIVSDFSTNEIIIYDISVIPAIELHRISTPANGIQGVKVGPDGKIYYADYNSNKVVSVTTLGVGIDEVQSGVLDVYPNPSTGELYISGASNDVVQLNVYNALGQRVFRDGNFAVNSMTHTELNSGVYTVEVERKNGLVERAKWIVQ